MLVRITNAVITTNAIRAMLTSQRGIDESTRRVTSGLRVDRLSADPTAGSEAMRAGSELRALTQYGRNLERATAASAAQENVLTSMSELLTRAQELAISQSSDTASAQTRAVVKAEVDQLLRMAAALANTQHEGVYLFGGAQSTTAPVIVIDGPVPSFTVGTAAPGPEYELAPGQRLRVADRAEEIFGTPAGGALASLRALSVALDANDRAAVQATSADLNAAFQVVQDRLGATGARANQLEVTRTNVDALSLTLTAYRSELVDVDIEQAITELVAKQTTYQAAMLATSKVIDLNLTNYIR
jgi:flagellar hook-associated protein 3 FlgL